MVPNHLFQLLSLIAMEPPSRFDARSVRSEKAAALDAVRIPTAANALRSSVRAQYAAGAVKGATVGGYRSAADVRPDSTTETYAALKLEIDNWRWAGVPFYLRTGKALAARRSEVAVKFKQAPYALFRDTPVEHLAQNYLVLRIQPDEGITLHFNAKVPGPAIAIDGVGMTFKYKDYFDAVPSTGYETLIYDCMIGDATLFQRAERSKPDGRSCSRFSVHGREREGRGLPPIQQAAKGPRRPTLSLNGISADGARLDRRSGGSQRPEERLDLAGQRLGLLHRGEVPAAFHEAPAPDVGEGALRDRARRP
jgi:glucose-6-phosphate 1-dehydrogenase